MNILAINTASERIELVLKIGDRIEYYANDIKEMASVVLLSEIDKLTEKLNVQLSEIDYFAVVLGPGSFTGIRIGVSTIRAFCQSLGKKAVAVNRLELMAYNSRNDNEFTVTIVDGQNGVSYISVYSGDANSEVLPPRPIRTSELGNFLNLIEEPFCVVSDSDLALDGYNVKIMTNTAEGLMGFVTSKIKNGKTVDYLTLEPLYIRKPQAEREAGEL